MRVLGIGAHPDDLEISCGGTLAKYASQGAQVFMAHLCNGNKGHMVIPPDELRIIRDNESKSSAKLIGATSINIDVDDMDAYLEREQIVKVVEVIRLAQPDIIITHAPNDYMPDHLAAGQITFSASFMATLPHVKTEHPFFEKITPIFYMENLGGANFVPEYFVDITGFLETKLKMMDQHQSQVKWLKEHDGTDFLDLIETSAKYRGAQAGVKHAEGFTRLNTWGRNPVTRLLP